MIQTLKIIDIGSNGDGIARAAEGQTVFVPYAVTGDVVSADVAKDKDGVLRGKIRSLEVKSEHRTVPPCRHFEVCGGCSLQHFEAGFYQRFKKESVLALLSKNEIPLPERIETVFIPEATRRRANFAAIVTRERTVIGFHERKSASIRDVPDCLLIDEKLRDVMEGFRPFLARLAGNGKKMDVLIQCIEGQAEIALTGTMPDTLDAKEALAEALRTLDLCRISLRARDYESYETLLEARPFFKKTSPFTIHLGAGAFLQPSEEGEAALIRHVLYGVGGAKRIADLFCGHGTFTGPLMMEEGRDVLAVDFAPEAIAGLKRAGLNAQLRDLFKNPMRKEEIEDRECVILDPPRAGAMAQVRLLAEAGVPNIVYVSCNPQSFAKDIKLLLEAGYGLTSLTLVDQFIWSTHTELVGVLTRRA